MDYIGTEFELLAQRLTGSEREHFDTTLYLKLNGHRRGKDWKPQLDAARDKLAYLEQEIGGLRRQFANMGRVPRAPARKKPAAKKA